MEPLTFNLRQNILPVIIEAEDGSQEAFELKEMKASVRDKYLDGMAPHITVGSDGIHHVKKFEGMQAALLAVTLFRKKNDEPVTREEIQKWPSSAVSNLFRASQKLNGLLGAEEENAPKND